MVTFIETLKQEVSVFFIKFPPQSNSESISYLVSELLSQSSVLYSVRVVKSKARLEHAFD